MLFCQGYVIDTSYIMNVGALILKVKCQKVKMCLLNERNVFLDHVAPQRFTEFESK